jgi:hypothetical protein
VTSVVVLVFPALAIGVYQYSLPPALAATTCDWGRHANFTVSGKISNPSPLPRGYVVVPAFALAGAGRFSEDSRVYVLVPPYGSRRWTWRVGFPERWAAKHQAITACSPHAYPSDKPDD